MKHVFNFGSLNIDHVYRVEHFVQPGETAPCLDYQKFAGGKGFNQSIALARAGLRVTHAGCIGDDGAWLRERLANEGANVSALQTSADAPTGHAIIQVDPHGENSILIHGGANQMLDQAFVERVLTDTADVDMVLLQNETSAARHVLEITKQRGLPVAFNPAPMTPEVANLPLENLSILFVNQIEAAGLVGDEKKPDSLCRRLAQRYPQSLCVLTAGPLGAWAAEDEQLCYAAGCPAQAVDTTAAGDTFIGFFLAEYLARGSVPKALTIANRAAALSVTRPGAADSIPTREQIAIN